MSDLEEWVRSLYGFYEVDVDAHPDCPTGVLIPNDAGWAARPPSFSGPVCSNAAFSEFVNSTTFAAGSVVAGKVEVRGRAAADALAPGTRFGPSRSLRLCRVCGSLRMDLGNARARRDPGTELLSG